MTATVLNAGNHERAFAPRRHERRRGFGELLAALTRGIDRRHDTSSMREAFEQMLRRIVPVRSIHVRDLAGRWAARNEATGLESIALEIPGADAGSQRVLVARQIHDVSRRRHGPFVAINCAALVETLLEAELFGIEDRTATGVRGRRGKFEHADGGTLFLDEVSDLSLPAQAKLLRAIQDLAVERVGGHGSHRVDIRIGAAADRGPSQLVERG